jgi:alpha-tubulin suppressor-like RCC1 family protein
VRVLRLLLLSLVSAACLAGCEVARILSDAAVPEDGDAGPADAGGDDDDDARADGGTSDGGDAAASADGGGVRDRPVQLALGESHSCVLTAQGSVFCWGIARDGVLGEGRRIYAEECKPFRDSELFASSSSPVRVLDLPPATQIAAGRNVTCAVHEPRPGSAGNLSCWGWAPSVEGHAFKPAPVVFESAELAGVAEVALGASHGCARRNDAPPVCWGLHFNGQLGNGTTSIVSGPVLASAVEAFAAPTSIRALALGARHSCMVHESTSVACWGSNEHGQAGQALDTSVILTPAFVPELDEVDSIVAGAGRTCALRAGNVWCFGLADWGQLGVFPADLPTCGEFYTCTFEPQQVSTAVVSEADVVELAGGDDFGCARTGDGNLGCWGRNDLGQLGARGFGAAGEHEVIVTLEDEVEHVAAGSNHACAIMRDESVVCWGNNSCGQLGQPEAELTHSEEPVLVSLPL